MEIHQAGNTHAYRAFGVDRVLRVQTHLQGEQEVVDREHEKAESAILCRAL